MKTSRIALVLLVMLALIPCARGFAQTAPAAPAPANVAEFLATLSGSSSDAPGTGVLIPNPTLLSTTCTSSTDCPPVSFAATPAASTAAAGFAWCP